jgi:4-hydroxyphenylpyruvate dioxygenase-like putative hemolysin
MAVTSPAPRETTHDFMPLHGIDHVELYVGNAAQAAYYYEHAFGFQRVAYAGLETGMRDQVSHVLQQGRIRLVLTGALRSNSPIAAHQHNHGDGVKVIARRSTTCVGNVELGRMDEWVGFYNRVIGLHEHGSSSATTSPPSTPR